jgi:hypothetical protein
VSVSLGVGAVHAAVELHEQALRLLRCAVHVVDAQVERLRPRLLGDVARHEPVELNRGSPLVKPLQELLEALPEASPVDLGLDE